jgi:hypothetical protein
VSDERYKKYLGIEPTDEIPTYYELFQVATDERDQEVLDKAYKTNIRRLQEIRSSKDGGFIEFLKEELRKAKRVLSNPEKRKAYDESLLADVLSGFRDFVGSLMVMGHINKTLYDTMVTRGVTDGLAEGQAKSAISELAKQHNATLETEAEEPPKPEESAPAGQGEAPRPRSGGEIVLKAPPSRRSASGDDRPRPEFARPGSEAQHQRPVSSGEHARRPAEREPSPRPKGPWYAGIGEQPPPWGRRAGSRRARPRRSAAPRRGAPAAPRRSAPRGSKLEEAIKIFNLGARLAKAAGDVHEKLRLYFPPANGKATQTKAINGITYQKVLDTEQSTYRDALKKFEASGDKIQRLEGNEADLVRSRSRKNVTLLKGYLEDIRQLKMRLLGGLPQQEELRVWQEFIGSTRSARVTRTIDE